MGLFKKELCCVCGEKTGLLDKKCYGGKVCKNCVKKLSPFFDNYQGCDKGLLEGQISMREMNEDLAKTLHFNKIFGEFGAILIDEEARKFIAVPDTGGGLFSSPKAVRSLEDVIVPGRGLDLFKFDTVKDCAIDITEITREETETVDGREQSYFPPRFVYSETFVLKMKIDHPFVKTIRVQLNNGAVQIHNIGRRLPFDPEAASPGSDFGFRPTLENRAEIERYQHFLEMAREIKSILTDN